MAKTGVDALRYWSFIRIAKEGGVEARVRVATELNLSIAARQEIHAAGRDTWTHHVAVFLENFIKSFFGKNLAKIL